MKASALNDEALGRFYEATAAPIRAYLLRHCSDRDSVDDLLQITFVKFMGSRMASTPEAREARAYLYRIASNVIADHGRALQRRYRVEDPESEAVAAAPEIPAEDNLALRNALLSLSKREQQLLWLLYAEGFSHKEVATIMKVNSGSVRVLAFRARKKLAERLGPAGPDSENAAS